MHCIHISDTHGRFPILPEDGEAVIHSGDFLPNASFGNRIIEPQFQAHWLRSNAEALKKWIGDRPFLFCGGNHDFIDPCPIMTELGIEAINLNDKVTSFKGINLYGFPYIPYIQGHWNYEKLLPEMNDEVNKMLQRIKDSQVGIDILVTHSPPHGILDVYNWEHLGNTPITNLLAYGTLTPAPKYLLCGHIHKAHGSAEVFGTIISNAATRVHSFEVLTEPPAALE